MSSNPFPLPPNLPVPVDDGAATHLLGLSLPDLFLPSTGDSPINLSALPGRSVIFRGSSSRFCGCPPFRWLAWSFTSG